MSVGKSHIYLKTKDYFKSLESFSIVKTDIPGILKTIPIPDHLDSYYDSVNYLSHIESPNTAIDYIYTFIRYINLKFKTSYLPPIQTPAPKLLDYGCGTGDFLVRANALGYQAEGYEPNEKAADILTKKGINTIKSIQNIDYQYDIITLWHVLEHIKDPKSILTSIIEHLKPGGLLLIAIPNYESWDAHHYNSYWAALDTPRHIWHYNSTGIRNLMAKYPLDYQKKVGQPFDAYYISLLSERYRKSRVPILKALIYGSISNLIALYNKEFSSNIYVFQRQE